jgi:hypothetical protein
VPDDATLNTLIAFALVCVLAVALWRDGSSSGRNRKL